MSSVSPISSQTLDPNALKSVMTRGSTEASKADAVGVQFEAIMIRQFLGDALKPMVKGALSEDGAGSDTYQYFLTDMLSQSLAQKGVFGIGQKMSAELKRKDAMLHPEAAESAVKGDSKQIAAPRSISSSRQVVDAEGTMINSNKDISGTQAAK